MRLAKREVSYLDGVMIFLLAIVANLAAQIILSIVITIGKTATGSESFGSGNYAQLVCMAVFQLVFLSVPVLYYLAKKTRPLLAYPVKNVRPSLALSVLLPAVSLIGFMLPALLFEEFLILHGYKPNGIEIAGAGQTALAVIVIGIMAPCIEELIFRGFLLGGLNKAFNPYAAAALSAAAFSLMHMNPEQTVYQFCLGFVCALAAIKSGTLLAAVITHAGSNITVLLAVGPLNRLFDVLTASTFIKVACAIGFFIAALAAVLGICKAMEIINRVCGKNKTENNVVVLDDDTRKDAQSDAVTDKKSRKTGLMIYIGGVGLCLIMWIFVMVAAFI